jgi:hypothetical protein
MNVRLNCAETCWATAKYDVKVNENTKISVSDRVNLCNLWKDPKNAAYSVGMAIEFKM